MKNRSTRPFRILTFAILAGPALLLAQDQPQPHGGWRRADTPPPAATTTDDPATPPPAFAQSEPRDQYGMPTSSGQQPPNGQQPRYGQQPNYGQQQPYGQQPANGQQYPPMGPPPQQNPPPAQLTMRPGTYLTVRVNQPLSSDHNQPGDAFTATLIRPLVVDGVVVAQTGETIGGRVVEAKKAGRVEGVSQLGIQLTDITLVDGQNVPIHTQLISRNGPTSVGRDVAAVGGTTALGAAVGASADWGRGAAIGAGAGAAAGLIGVLLTRGHPTVVYPEQMLTFRVEQPVIIATDRAPQAFRYVEPEDYNQGLQASRPMSPRPYGPPPSLYGGGYPYYGPPAVYPYWGPSYAFFYGPRFYGPGLYFGHYGGRWRR